MADWEDQYRRVKRWLKRIRNPLQDHIDYEDYLLAFFQNCWHLKDWIYNDQSMNKSTRNSIVQSAERSIILKLCYDVATRSKHLNLKKPQRNARLIGGIGLRLGDPVTRKSKVIRSYVVTDSRGRTVSMFDLAHKAASKWGQILRKNGLNPPRR